MSHPRQPHPDNPIQKALVSAFTPPEESGQTLEQSMQALKDRLDAEAAEEV